MHTQQEPRSLIDDKHVVGRGRLELPTSRLSGVRSNQLSYRPEGSLNFEAKLSTVWYDK